MSADARIIRERLLPEEAERLVRQFKLDKWTGFVQLNILEGRIVNLQHMKTTKLTNEI